MVCGPIMSSIPYSHLQMTPSKFLFDMQMDTEQKLANTHTMRIPRKIQLLDMADTSLQRVTKDSKC